MKSATRHSHSFRESPAPHIPRSTFDLSHSLKTTFDAGLLVPIHWMDVLPGDQVNLSLEHFCRLNTPIHPILDNMHMDVHFFFVPNRLLWENWERMQGAQDNPGDSTDFLVPAMTTGGLGVQTGTVEDYLGIPMNAPNLTHSALFHRAYNRVYNDFYRDKNLQDRAVQNVDDGPDVKADYPMRRRGKPKDYFTSCLPFLQKGPAVQLPLGETAPVAITGVVGQPPRFNLGADSNIALQYTTGTTDETNWNGLSNPAANPLATWDDPQLTGIADLSAATSAPINAIREAFAVQRLFELDARGGTEYFEILNAHFGVSSPDHRLMRSEYLGGGTSSINISAVPQTSSTDGTSPQGNLAAFGTVNGSGIGYRRVFPEHGIVIGLASVRADLHYQHGLERAMSKRTRFDHYMVEFKDLGEQAVLQQEIFARGSDDVAGDALVFGYQERWAEYRTKNSVITGLMRSDATGSLDVWHLAEKYATAPVLDDDWIQQNPPLDRVVAITDEPDFKMDGFFQMHVTRPMGRYSIPGGRL